jgi:hypothetical protein
MTNSTERNFADGWTFETAEARLRTLATNAVHEARKPFGREHEPWTDNDASTVENIYQLLHAMEIKGGVNRDVQHDRLAEEKPHISRSSSAVREALLGLHIHDRPTPRRALEGPGYSRPAQDEAVAESA